MHPHDSFPNTVSKHRKIRGSIYDMECPVDLNGRGQKIRAWHGHAIGYIYIYIYLHLWSCHWNTRYGFPTYIYIYSIYIYIYLFNVTCLSGSWLSELVSGGDFAVVSGSWRPFELSFSWCFDSRTTHGNTLFALFCEMFLHMYIYIYKYLFIYLHFQLFCFGLWWLRNAI